MSDKLYIIEKRGPDMQLDFTAPQPEDVFGRAAITGITEDQMARTVFNRCPDAVLTGDSIIDWPSYIDPRFIARRKTWS